MIIKAYEWYLSEEYDDEDEPEKITSWAIYERGLTSDSTKDEYVATDLPWRMANDLAAHHNTSMLMFADHEEESKHPTVQAKTEDDPDELDFDLLDLSQEEARD